MSNENRVLTNDAEVAYAVEQSLGVLPSTPEWHKLDVNNPANFGNSISKVSRAPISKDRQRRKGTVTDLDSTPEMEADLTLSQFRHFCEGFLFSNAEGAPVLTPSAAASGSFTVPAVSAADAGKMIYGASAAKSLLVARGFAESTNKGLLVLGGDVSTNDTSITVAGVVVEATVATKAYELAVAGVRGAAGDLEIDANGDLISTVLDLTTLGLIVGQQIHVGGPDAANNFATAANTGFARVKSVATNKVELERRQNTFVADDGNGVEVDILFGQFVRNVASDDANYLERSFQFEMTNPNTGAGNADTYEYAKGNLCNTLNISVPLTDKAVMTYGFVGTETTVPSLVRATGAANAKDPMQVEAFGSSEDVARLSVFDIDESGLSTDFKSVTLNITNNASGEKVIGNLGAKYINTGLFEVDIDAEMLFTNADVVSRIRNNTTIGFSFALYNDDGGIFVDIPAGTIDGGDRDFPTNESVVLRSQIMAHKDDVLGTSIGISIFPALPTQI